MHIENLNIYLNTEDRIFKNMFAIIIPCGMVITVISIRKRKFKKVKLSTYDA